MDTWVTWLKPGVNEKSHRCYFLTEIDVIAGRSGLYHPLPETDIRVVLIFGSKDQRTNGALPNGYLS